MTGTVFNAAAIAVGAAMGLGLRSRLPERVSTTVISGVGMVVLLIGVQMGLESQNIILPLLSVVIGGAIGEFINIEQWLEKFSQWAETKLRAESSQFSKGFVAASLVYLVGPMAIIGAINDGLNGDYRILLTKSMLDGITSIAFASSLGIGVLFSAVPVFLYQGAMTLGAVVVKGLFSDPVVREMTATGGLLIMGIGINILGLARVRVGNLLPGLLIIVALVKILMAFHVQV